ncbi:hypothetical protein SFRURICE_000304, partial [Spodoptera frugiperda]
RREKKSTLTPFKKANLDECGISYMNYSEKKCRNKLRVSFEVQTNIMKNKKIKNHAESDLKQKILRNLKYGIYDPCGTSREKPTTYISRNSRRNE